MEMRLLLLSTTVHTQEHTHTHRNTHTHTHTHTCALVSVDSASVLRVVLRLCCLRDDGPFFRPDVVTKYFSFEIESIVHALLVMIRGPLVPRTLFFEIEAICAYLSPSPASVRPVLVRIFFRDRSYMCVNMSCTSKRAARLGANFFFEIGVISA